MGTKWTADEDRYLAETMNLTRVEVAERLNRTPFAIGARRQVLGLQRTFRFWTEEDDRCIRETMHLSALEVAERLNRTKEGVGTRRMQLGLKSQRSRATVAGIRTCEQCGIEYRCANRPNKPNRFCSKICRGKASREQTRAIRSRTCEHCGKQFVVSDTAVAGRWCSRVCQWREQAEPRKVIEAKPAISKNCNGCGLGFTTKHPTQSYCTERCRQGAYNARNKEARNKRLPNPLEARTCIVCSAEFLGNPNCVCCSVKCTKRFHRKRHGGKHRERARKAGVFYEPINVLTVFERDGWRCQICGVKTPKRLRGKNQDRSPELDHRIPLAMGGDHTYENVQCACRKCNLKKLDKQILGQLSLFPDMRNPARKVRRHRIDGETLVG